MTTAYVIMTAMPVTKGHIKLIEFAAYTADNVRVILCTQPTEPFVIERHEALLNHFMNDPHISIENFHKEVPQDPSTPGFQNMWAEILRSYGCTGGRDVLVASEPYGVWLANILGVNFVPYDPDRELTPVKATDVRADPWNNFHLIADQFQQFVRVDVTIFGAESTGKTTLARLLAEACNGHYFYEWARPYLETVGTEINVKSMTDIWDGQYALEMHANDFYDRPIHFYDTDLYSTIGYWQQPHWAEFLGPVPQGLIDAAGKADLYLITQSNIPFEEDPLRYGGDHRESDDQYWIDIADQYHLNYVVLNGQTLNERLAEALDAIQPLKDKMRASLAYDRQGF